MSNPKCYWKILEQFNGECGNCEFLHPCLIESVIIRGTAETDFITFKTKLERAIKQANSIWKQIQTQNKLVTFTS